MRLFVATFLLVTGLFHGLCLALDFKITEVVPVGPIYGGGLTEPAQWSPDGTKLAYFSEGHLMIADTLGNSRAAAEIDLPPHRFVWASNSEILVYQRQQFRDTTDKRLCSLNRLISVNIETGYQATLEEFIHKIANLSDPPRFFKGPYLTVEGNAYYRVEEEGVEMIQMAPGLPREKATLKQNHILRTENDSLYLVRADFKDSVKISGGPCTPSSGRNLSFDRAYIMCKGVIVRLSDQQMIILDTVIEKFPKPEGTKGCGFGDESFNPLFPEVAFRLTCDDGHDYIIRRMGVFDYTTNELTFLDSLINLSNCYRPSYAPDGRRILFVSEGVLYFVNREF